MKKLEQTLSELRRFTGHVAEGFTSAVWHDPSNGKTEYRPFREIAAFYVAGALSSVAHESEQVKADAAGMLAESVVELEAAGKGNK